MNITVHIGDLFRKVQSNRLRSPANTSSKMTGNEIDVNMWWNRHRLFDWYPSNSCFIKTSAGNSNLDWCMSHWGQVCDTVYHIDTSVLLGNICIRLIRNYCWDQSGVFSIFSPVGTVCSWYPFLFMWLMASKCGIQWPEYNYTVAWKYEYIFFVVKIVLCSPLKNKIYSLAPPFNILYVHACHILMEHTTVWQKNAFWEPGHTLQWENIPWRFR